MEELAGLLSRERVLLELLLFKLVELRQLLLAGEVRFLSWAGEEVERACEKLRTVELSRAMLVAELAEKQGQANVTLRALAESAPEPWRTIFADHRQAFLTLAAEIEESMAAARRLATAGGEAIAELLDRMSSEVSGQGEAAGAGVGAAGGLGGARIGAPYSGAHDAATYGPTASWQPAQAPARVMRTL